MQDTRLNRILTESGSRIEGWFQHPWRRFVAISLMLLGGFFLGNMVTTTTGQTAQIDGLIGLILVIVVESVNWIAYRGRPFVARALWLESLNTLKIGFTYALFLDALKLGS
jgi:uncharacterized membrane-anchored protein